MNPRRLDWRRPQWHNMHPRRFDMWERFKSRDSCRCATPCDDGARHARTHGCSVALVITVVDVVVVQYAVREGQYIDAQPSPAQRAMLCSGALCSGASPARPPGPDPGERPAAPPPRTTCILPARQANYDAPALSMRCAASSMRLRNAVRFPIRKPCIHTTLLLLDGDHQGECG